MTTQSSRTSGAAGPAVLAVVGSREIQISMAVIRLAIRRVYRTFDLPKPNAFASGGAKGVDTVFEQLIERRYKLMGEEAPFMRFEAKWWYTDQNGNKVLDRGAGIKRTRIMLQECKPTVIAITAWDHRSKNVPEPSKGTMHTLRMSSEMGLPTFWMTWDARKQELLGRQKRNAKRLVPNSLLSL